MRFVIYGAGGIGGTIGARLHQAGFDVTLIARGAHFAAIANNGLRFVSPSQDVRLTIDCVEHPAEANIAPDDAVILCMKSQHTEQALRDLQGAVGDAARVICCQNGVDNERMALRRFPHTYGMVVFLPAEHLEPGVVVNFAEGSAGGLDTGVYPTGVDDFIAGVAAALTTAGFTCAADPRVMRQKYSKLLANLNNAVQAVTGGGFRDLAAALRTEALACYKAAGIDCSTAEEDRARRSGIGGASVPGHERHGGSSLQSMMRGTGNLEVDYLNGEIVTLGRLHGVPTPANAVVQRLANRVLRKGFATGHYTLDNLREMIEREQTH